MTTPADFTAAIEKLQRARDFHRDEADRLTVEISGLLMAAIEADAAALEARIGGYPGGGLGGASWSGEHSAARDARCGSCGQPAEFTITLRGRPIPACLRHLNHWRTPASDYTCPTACVEQNHPGREHAAWLADFDVRVAPPAEGAPAEHGYGVESDCACGRNFVTVRGLREHLTKARLRVTPNGGAA